MAHSRRVVRVVFGLKTSNLIDKVIVPKLETKDEPRDVDEFNSINRIMAIPMVEEVDQAVAASWIRF
jgi:hypothetical protein